MSRKRNKNKKLKKRKNRRIKRLSFRQRLRMIRLSDRQLLIYFSLTLVLALVITFTSVNAFMGRINLTNPNKSTLTSTPTPTSSILNRNEENVDLILSSDGFNPSSITLQKSKEYNFRIVKESSSTCQAVKNSALGYSIELNKTANSFPVSIPTQGEYSFECIGQSANLKVQVK